MGLRPAAKGGGGDPRSRATRIVLILGAILLLAAITGVLRVDRGISVTDEQAIAIARTQIDFTPEQTSVRLVRRGFGGAPYWAISFSVPAPGGEGYVHLTTVLIDARSGEIKEVTAQ